MTTVRTALGYSFLTRYSAMFINFVATLFIARLLTPAEIGVFSVSASLVGIAQILRDFGVGNYLIQEKELTPEKIRSAFTVSLLMGVFLASCLLVLAEPAAIFYRSEEMRSVMRVLALSFLFIPLNSPALALLRRDLRFDLLMIVQIFSAIVSSSLSITLAYHDHGAISLAWGSFAGVLSSVLVTAVLRSSFSYWKPSLHAWRRVLSFGGYSTAASLVSEFGTSMPDFVVGRYISLGAVGYYSRASGVLSFFRQSIQAAVMPVALPAFSQRIRSGENPNIPYLQSVAIMTAMAWPIIGFLGLMAQPIIFLLYGRQWGAAVPVAQILCVANLIYYAFSLSGAILVGLGAVRQNFHKELLIQPLRIALVFFAVSYGLWAIAAVQIAIQIWAFGVTQYYLRSLMGLTLRAQAKTWIPSLGVSLVALVAPATVQMSFPEIVAGATTPMALVVRLGLASLGFGAGWLVGVFVFNHPIKAEVLGLLATVRLRLAHAGGRS